jgi:hypothetical protein
LSPRSVRDADTPRRNKKIKKREAISSSSDSDRESTVREHTSERKRMTSSHTSDLLGKKINQRISRRDQNNTSVLSSKRGSSESEVKLKQKNKKKPSK